MIPQLTKDLQAVYRQVMHACTILSLFLHAAGRLCPAVADSNVVHASPLHLHADLQVQLGMVRGLGVDGAFKFSAIVKGSCAHHDVHHAGQAHAAPDEGHSDGGEGYEGA